MEAIGIIIVLWVLCIVAEWIDRKRPPEDRHCPVCGYYCLGKGGMGCIDKPNLYERD